MLLKLGTAMMAVALAFAAVVAAATFLFAEPMDLATAAKSTTTPAKEPLTRSDPGVDPWVERNVPAPQPISDPQPPPGPSPEPQAEALPTPELQPEPQPEPAPEPEPQAQPEPEATPEQEILPVPDEGWPGPSAEEVAAASSPRHYPWQEDAVFTLTIEALEIYDAPVLDSTSQEALNSGVVHIPETPMPWEGGQQKNVYLAGHRVGYPGTASRVLFYHLDRLSSGDAIVLEDRSGNAYRYRVSEIFVVEPDAGWVLDPVRNRDMVTLQTCTYPTFENRLIVRADRV